MKLTYVIKHCVLTEYYKSEAVLNWTILAKSLLVSKQFFLPVFDRLMNTVNKYLYRLDCD